MNTTKNTNFSCNTKTNTCEPNNDSLPDNNTMETVSSTSKLKIIYYYDALCGWCYGFSAVIAKLYEEYKNEIDIELISGGLFLGKRTGFINDVAPYIKAGAYKSVELTTGTKFGEDFLSTLFGDGKMVLHSLPPSIALCIVKEKFPERQLKFGEMLLNAIYFDGLSADDMEGLAQYALKIGVDKEEFMLKMQSEEYKKMAEKEFEIFSSSTFGGMPTLVIENPGNPIVLSNGYTSLDDLRLRLQSFLKSS